MMWTTGYCIGAMIRPMVQHVAVDNRPIRMWQPDDPESFSELIRLEIGPKAAGGADTFTIRVASPRGLAALEVEGCIIAQGRMLVMRRWDPQVFVDWIDHVVSQSSAATWADCTDRLRAYLGYEYERYTEGT